MADHQDFTIRLHEHQWNILDRIAQNHRMAMKQVFEAAVAAVPAEPEKFIQFMGQRPAGKRKRGVERPPRGLSISNECWAKVKRLSQQPEYFPSLHPESPAEETSDKQADGAGRPTYTISEILRAAIERFLGENRGSVEDIKDALYWFLNKPLLITEPLTFVKSSMRASLVNIPKGMPVLIDHTILILALLRNHEFTTVESFSREAFGLIHSSLKRQVFLHRLHQDRFLVDLAAVLASNKIRFWDDGEKLVSAGCYLATKASQLADLDIRILPLDVTDVATLEEMGDFAERFAVASARKYLGTAEFAFASAVLNKPTIDGVTVYAPRDYCGK